RLERIDIAGGSPQLIANTGTTRSGAWNADGTILFSSALGNLSRVAASGGDPIPFKRHPISLFDANPQFLPDGRHFLYCGGGNGGFSVSRDGQIAYRNDSAALRQCKWYDRNGKVLGAAGEPDPSSPGDPELSPDGTRLAFGRTAANSDVWLMDLLRGGMTRFT